MVVHSVGQVAAGDELLMRVQDGEFGAVTEGERHRRRAIDDLIMGRPVVGTGDAEPQLGNPRCSRGRMAVPEERVNCEGSWKKLSFEEAFGELEATVQRLEAGDLTLDEAVALYERGWAWPGVAATPWTPPSSGCRSWQ